MPATRSPASASLSPSFDYRRVGESVREGGREERVGQSREREREFEAWLRESTRGEWLERNSRGYGVSSGTLRRRCRPFSERYPGGNISTP